jgi:hypothetical protein
MKMKHDLPCTFRLSSHLMRAVKYVLRFEESMTAFVSAALLHAVCERLNKHRSETAIDFVRQAVGLAPIFGASQRELTAVEREAHPVVVCENGVHLEPCVQRGYVVYRRKAG